MHCLWHWYLSCMDGKAEEKTACISNASSLINCCDFANRSRWHILTAIGVYITMIVGEFLHERSRTQILGPDDGYLNILRGPSLQEKQAGGRHRVLKTDWAMCLVSTRNFKEWLRFVTFVGELPTFAPQFASAMRYVPRANGKKRFMWLATVQGIILHLQSSVQFTICNI